MYAFSMSTKEDNGTNVDGFGSSFPRNDAISNIFTGSTAVPVETKRRERNASIRKSNKSSNPVFIHHHNSPSISVASNSSFNSFTFDKIIQSHEGRLSPPPLFPPTSEPQQLSWKLKTESTYFSCLPEMRSNNGRPKEYIRKSGNGVARPMMKSVPLAPANLTFKGYPRLSDETVKDSWSLDVSSRSNRSKNRRRATPSKCRNPGKYTYPVVEDDDESDKKLPAIEVANFVHQRENIHDHYYIPCPKLQDDRSTGDFSDLTSSTRRHAYPAPEDISPTESTEKYIEVYPGLIVPFRGTSETMQAIYEDKFSPNWCYLCNETIFCIQGADYVLCPLCKVIAPADVSDNKSLNNCGGVGIGFTMELLSDAISNLQVRTKH